MENLHKSHRTSLAPDSSTSKLNDFKAPTFKDDALVLYFHPYNFHSQKVLFLLYEKNIDFIPYVLDLANGEQYSSWFLNLNPKGDVPVLQDGAFVIPDSRYIINYIDGKFIGDQYPTLKPKNSNSPDYRKIQQYENIIAKLPIGALSMGSFIHDDLKLIPKAPFIGPVRQSCLKNNEKVFELLKQSIEETTANKADLKRKLQLQEKRKELVMSRVEYQKVLDSVQNVLNYIEKELAVNESSEWLISNDFTMADICLGLLLYRLYQLGFENYYWSYGKMPHIESFFLRFRKRTSYQKLVPSNFEILKDIWQKTPTNYKIGASVISMAVFTALAHK